MTSNDLKRTSISLKMTSNENDEPVLEKIKAENISKIRDPKGIPTQGNISVEQFLSSN